MIIQADCVAHMATMPADSVDAIVTDPPYGLGFMGKAWDKLPPGRDWARECLRVLKPGGHIVAFGGQRTIHRLICSLEDAGFEIRDLLGWLQWQGFPKSRDVSKAIDAAAGAEREVLGPSPHSASRTTDNEGERTITVPATDAAKQWDGWGTALKPCIEPATIARKPLSERTVAANVLKWGTGAINIDACRYAVGDRAWPGPQDDYGAHTDGRWPANIYACPKASRSEREAGCESLPAMAGYEAIGRKEGTKSIVGANRTAATINNSHPTVKPVALMRWLVRLVTPPGGVVLDTFAGSGTTGVAAAYEGFDFLGIEINDDYCAISRARIAHALGSDAPKKRRRPEAAPVEPDVVDPMQLDMWG